MASIRLNKLTKRWGDFISVNNQSLDIADKEFLVLLGPSGCGKTTTMRMIAGLEEPTSGDIFIGEDRVNDMLPKDRDVAMVFQNYGLYPHMTIFDNIAYPLKVRGVASTEIGPRVEKAAGQVELSEFLDRKPKALSGGQRQRVALARAIVRTPRVFLMDEPLSNLDAKLRVSMRAELKHLSQALKITTVYVTHDQIEAMTLADRVAVMKGGVVLQLGTPDDIYNDPANLFVAGFIGSPAMNLIEGRIVGGQFVTTDGTALIRASMSDREGVTLGVRADDLAIGAPGAGDVDASIYAFENTGESTLLTVQWGKQRIIVRGDRHLRESQGETVSLRFDTGRLYYFDTDTEARITDACGRDHATDARAKSPLDAVNTGGSSCRRAAPMSRG